MTHKNVVYKYGTGNPVQPNGSGDVRDGIDNLMSFDIFMNDESDTYNQRDGEVVQTIAGAIRSSGFKPVSFTFATGGTLAAGDFDKAVYNPTPNGDNNWYAWGGAMPKTIPPGSTPQTSGGFGKTAWLQKTDNILKPSVRESLRRSYADAGYALVAGSFESGGVLTSAADVLLHEATGKAYSGAGPFPQTVIAGTVPSGSYTDQSGKLLRQEVGLLGQKVDRNRNNLTLSKVKIWAELDATFPGYETLISTYGYDWLYPQAFNFFDEDSEFYITFTKAGGSNDWAWIVCYDSNTKAIKSIFSAGDFNSEGVHVARIDGVKYLITLETASGLGAGKTGVYILPANIASINMTRLTATRICNTQQGSQLTGYRERILMEVNAGNSAPTSVQVRSTLRIFNVADLVASSTPVSVGAVSLSRNNSMTVKRQAIGFGDGEILCGFGALYLSTDGVYVPSQQYGVKILNMNGLEKAEFIASPGRVMDALQPHTTTPVTRIENEGAAYSAISGSLRPYTLTMIGGSTAPGSDGGILILENGLMGGEDGIDLISCQSWQGMVDNNNDTSIQILERPFDRTQNKQLTTLAQIIDVMVRDGIQYYRFYNHAGWAITDINGNPISGSTTVTIHNNNSNTYFVHVFGAHVNYVMQVTGAMGGPYGQTMSMFVQANDSAVRPEFLRSAGVVFGANGLPAFNMYTNTSTGTTTANRYINGTALSGGTIAGSIIVNNATTTTAFNTTSDETLKDKGEVYADGLGKVCGLIEGGALRRFIWKSNGLPDYGFMAQTLEQYVEKAVCVDTETGLYQVDYSKLVPDLLSAVYALKREIDELKRNLP